MELMQMRRALPGALSLQLPRLRDPNRRKDHAGRSELHVNRVRIPVPLKPRRRREELHQAADYENV